MTAEERADSICRWTNAGIRQVVVDAITAAELEAEERGRREERERRMVLPSVARAVEQIEALKFETPDDLTSDKLRLVIEAAKLEIEWMSAALNEVAEVTEPYRSSKDHSPITTIKYLIEEVIRARSEQKEAQR